MTAPLTSAPESLRSRLAATPYVVGANDPAAVTRRNDSYTEFLQTTATAPEGLPPLDPLESRILELVALGQQNGAGLSVRELMTRRDLASSVTLHGRLKSMREKGWILLADTEHRQRKRLEPTPAALSHLDWLGNCLLAAAKDVEKSSPVPLANSETRVAHAGNLASGDAGIPSTPPSPVVGWQTGSTGESVELRISVTSASCLDALTGEHGFLLDPEQARQIIRDLSAAVLASDVKRLAARAAPSLLPVHDWHIDTTGLRVAMRLCAEGSPDGSVTAGEHGFVMTAEHAPGDSGPERSGPRKRPGKTP